MSEFSYRVDQLQPLADRLLAGQVLGSPPGRIFYVNSNGGVDAAGYGMTRSNIPGGSGPFATWAYAITQCGSNQGDVIFLLNGHTETVSSASGVTFSGKTGVYTIGCGSGADRPTITFATSTAATVALNAASTFVKNVLFVNNIDGLVTGIVVSAADCKLIDIETRETTGKQAVDFISTTSAADRLLIENYIHRGDAGTAGADTAITIVGGDAITIRDFQIDGNFAVAGIENVTTAATNLRIYGSKRPSYIWTRNAADVAVTLASGTTGDIGPNIYAMLTDNAANITEAFVGAGARFFQPIAICNLAGEVGMNTNITASTDA